MSFSNTKKWSAIKENERDNIALQPSRLHDEDLFLLSPDKFWMLEISGPIRRTEFYQRLMKTKIGVFATGGGSSEFYGPVIRAESIKDAVAKSLIWADRMMLEYARRLFLNQWQASGRITPELAIAREEGVRKGRRYLSEFLRGEGSKMAAPPKLQRSMATYYIKQFANYLEKLASSNDDIDSLEEIAFFLSIDPLYRPIISDKLAVIADRLECLGKIKYKKNPPPKKKSKNRNASQLISKCQKLWEIYYDNPTEKNLKTVFTHLDKMKKSRSEKVRRERARCLRAANRE